jgi:hypothetical protein
MKSLLRSHRPISAQWLGRDQPPTFFDVGWPLPNAMTAVDDATLFGRQLAERVCHLIPEKDLSGPERLRGSLSTAAFFLLLTARGRAPGPRANDLSTWVMVRG